MSSFIKLNQKNAVFTNMVGLLNAQHMKLVVRQSLIYMVIIPIPMMTKMICKEARKGVRMKASQKEKMKMHLPLNG